MSGTFNGLKIVNSPQRVFSVGNDDPLTISGVTIDNCTPIRECSMLSI